jgi:hypothetical protein
MRQPRSYARRGPDREPYDSVLIICEGGKTEPYYFNRLRAVYRLSSANVKIAPADGTDPMSVVRFAEAELARGGYDRAYCVFDRDGHANYAQALNTVSQSAEGRAGRLVAIPSVPCFEVWVLLHFIYSTAPFNAVGNTSACDHVLREVQKHLPTYAKGSQRTFDDLSKHMMQAIKHAIQLWKHNVNSQSNNPATAVHRLVEYLTRLKG